MVYDDEYWLKGRAGAQKQPVAPRTASEAIHAAPKRKSHDSAPNPSPLLVEWLKARGLAVK